MEGSTIVIDLGTSTTLAGFGGDSEPSVEFSTVLGRPRNSPYKATLAETDFIVGSQVYKKASSHIAKYPLDNRVVSDFDDYLCYLYTLINKNLNTTPNAHPLLMTISPHESDSSKEKILQIIFETFKVPAFYPASPAAMTLYASGITSGIVVDAGETGTYMMPIFECYSMPYCSSRLDVGGRHVTDILRKAIIQRGYSLKSGTERDILRDLKSKICYIAQDPTDVQGAPLKTFTTPDGVDIKLTAQAFLAPEVLFKPSLSGCTQQGTSKLVADVINKVDSDIKELLARNIILAGGSTMFPGYSERLSNNLREILPDINTKVFADSARKYSAWVGGSILASVGTFDKLYITRDEYEDVGPNMILQLKAY